MPRTFAEPKTMTAADAVRMLSRKTFEDAVLSGWLKPRAQREVRRGKPRAIYATQDVREVEERILNGEYPQP